jgi:hypothetical protein
VDAGGQCSRDYAVSVLFESGRIEVSVGIYERHSPAIFLPSARIACTFSWSVVSV